MTCSARPLPCFSRRCVNGETREDDCGGSTSIRIYIDAATLLITSANSMNVVPKSLPLYEISRCAPILHPSKIQNLSKTSTKARTKARPYTPNTPDSSAITKSQNQRTRGNDIPSAPRISRCHNQVPVLPLRSRQHHLRSFTFAVSAMGASFKMPKLSYAAFAGYMARMARFVWNLMGPGRVSQKRMMRRKVQEVVW